MKNLWRIWLLKLLSYYLTRLWKQYMYVTMVTKLVSSYCWAHLVESYCKELDISYFNNIEATIFTFWLIKNMSINLKSAQFYKWQKVKLSAKKWNWVLNGEVENDWQLLHWAGSNKMADKHYSTWRLKLFIY